MSNVVKEGKNDQRENVCGYFMKASTCTCMHAPDLTKITNGITVAAAMHANTHLLVFAALEDIAFDLNTFP